MGAIAELWQISEHSRITDPADSDDVEQAIVDDRVRRDLESAPEVSTIGDSEHTTSRKGDLVTTVDRHPDIERSLPEKTGSGRHEIAVVTQHPRKMGCNVDRGCAQAHACDVHEPPN